MPVPYRLGIDIGTNSLGWCVEARTSSHRPAAEDNCLIADAVQPQLQSIHLPSIGGQRDALELIGLYPERMDWTTLDLYLFAPMMSAVRELQIREQPVLAGRPSPEMAFPITG